MSALARYADWRASEQGAATVRSATERALSLRRRGFERFGIAAIFEAMRYDAALRLGPDSEGFKLNNSFRSLVAREIMATVPELVDFFETRELHGFEPRQIDARPSISCRACVGQVVEHAAGCPWGHGEQARIF